jgi:hypothetical protein
MAAFTCSWNDVGQSVLTWAIGECRLRAVDSVAPRWRVDKTEGNARRTDTKGQGYYSHNQNARASQQASGAVAEI